MLCRLVLVVFLSASFFPDFVLAGNSHGIPFGNSQSNKSPVWWKRLAARPPVQHPAPTDSIAGLARNSRHYGSIAPVTPIFEEEDPLANPPRSKAPWTSKSSLSLSVESPVHTFDPAAYHRVESPGFRPNRPLTGLEAFPLPRVAHSTQVSRPSRSAAKAPQDSFSEAPTARPHLVIPEDSKKTGIKKITKSE